MSLSRTFAATNSCTITRLVEVQRWPAVPTAPKKIDWTAISRSALGVTMSALLPPSSRIVRAGSRHQWNPRIIRQFLADRFTIAHQQSENRRISAGLATNALGNFRDRNRCERRFFRRFPNGGVTAHCSESRVPRPNCYRKVERGNHCDYAERVPLFH